MIAEAWEHPYSRAKAVYPMAGLRQSKFWPATSRLNDTYGDRNLVCSCPPMESLMDAEDVAEMEAAAAAN